MVFLVCFIEELVETRLGEEGLISQFRAKLAGHDAGSEHVKFVFYLVDTGGNQLTVFVICLFSPTSWMFITSLT
jgi:hypothetical protein